MNLFLGVFVLAMLWLPCRAEFQCNEYFYEVDSTSIEIRVGNIPILRHTKEEPSVEVGIAVSSFRFNHGNFHVHQDVKIRRQAKHFELNLPENYLTDDERISGHAKHLELLFFESDQDNRPTVSVDFKCGSRGNNHIKVKVLDQDGPPYNRLWLKLSGEKDEYLYGGGEQYSHFNLKGQAFPMWCREQGVGRDHNIVTYLAELIAGAGGDYHTTYWPQPTFVSSRLYYIHLDHKHYNVLNFTNKEVNEIEMWGDLDDVDIYMDTAETWPSLLTKLTGFFGRQPAPPTWLYNGAILGLQGGRDEVLKKYQRIKDSGAKISAVWIQDWAGKIMTSLGKRVFWNWELDEEFYWDRNEMKARMQTYKTEGLRFLSYINPHIIKDSRMYKFADQKGYFIKNSTTGETFLVDFGEFDCGSVDFTNPEAYNWYKTVLKDMVEIGFSGWMADFGGEYLPVSDDMAFFNRRQDSESMHNHYSYLWAKLNREVYEEDGTGDIFIFMRSGYGESPGETLMAWAGDQNVDFFRGDGLPSVIPASLSLGMSDAEAYECNAHLMQTGQRNVAYIDKKYIQPTN